MEKAFLMHAECVLGYPNSDFEEWYQLGMTCHMSRLPKWIRKQAFLHLAKQWRQREKPVLMWHVRAFIHGTTGEDYQGKRNPDGDDSVQWPDAPPAGWVAVICRYEDGYCEFDYVHPVSRRFWSEDHDFFDLPADPKKIRGSRWFADLGFEIMQMSATLKVVASTAKPYLKSV